MKAKLSRLQSSSMFFYFWTFQSVFSPVLCVVEICQISIFIFLIFYDIISKTVLRYKINVLIFDFHASHFLKIFKRTNFFQFTNRNKIKCSVLAKCLLFKRADFLSVTHCLCAIWKRAVNAYSYVCYAHKWLTFACGIYYTRKRTHAETYIIYCV